MHCSVYTVKHFLEWSLQCSICFSLIYPYPVSSITIPERVANCSLVVSLKTYTVIVCKQMFAYKVEVDIPIMSLGFTAPPCSQDAAPTVSIALAKRLKSYLPLQQKRLGTLQEGLQTVCLFHIDHMKVSEEMDST